MYVRRSNALQLALVRRLDLKNVKQASKLYSLALRI